ncbi:MAG: restriction endonuclease subunit S, partial [Bacteroidales bacterium]|nr:restriction endonuclease subunit S [Bacteroidales bacterium]
VPQNSIIFSKINARHGCIYYHQDETPFVVSNEYPVFLVDLNKVNGEYLKQYLRSSRLKEHLNSKTTGISKARIKSDEFLSVPFPLKPLDVQQTIINDYQQKIEEAISFLLELKNKEDLIEQTINEILQVELPITQEKKKGIYFSKFSEITRWDIWVNEAIGQSKKFRNGFFQEVVIGNPMYGANVKSVDIQSDVRYIRITDINEDGTLNEDFVSAEKVEEKYLLKENDFLIARSGNTVGKTFLYKNENGKAIFAGYLVKYELNLDKVIPDYIFYYTKSRLFKNWIKSNQRIAGQPNINGQEYLYSPIVLPPISVQSEIVKKVKIIKDEFQVLKLKAESKRKEAIKEFEQAIFKN